MQNQNINSLNKSIFIAVIIYAMLSLADGFLSLPLREISSFLCFSFLKTCGLPIEINGTILSTPRMTFDVVPACSGSTTLRTMILAGIIWTAIKRNLAFKYKIIICISTIPLAILANSLRLSALVTIGHLSYKPVDGVLHSLTGVIAFILAFGAMVYLGSLYSKKGRSQESPHKYERALLEGTLFLLWALPTLAWFYRGWKSSPLDRLGFFWAIAATVLFVFTVKKKGRTASSKKLEWAIILLFFISEIFNFWADINLLHAINLALLIAYLILRQYGKSIFFTSIPLLIFFMLSFPTTTFIATQVLEHTVASANTLMGISFKLVLSLLLIISWLFLLRKLQGNKAIDRSTHRGVIFSVIVGLALLLNSFASQQKPPVTSTSSLKLSYFLNDWVGTNTDIGKGAPNLWSRSYTKNNKVIEVIINASGGNRHELHPPEYCLTGAGWLLKNEHVIDTGKGRINEMELHKQSKIKFFYHWYTDGESNFSSYKGMLTEDTLRQLQGKTTNWFLFRVIADSPQAVLNDFLTHFHGYFQQGQKEISF